VSSKLLDWDQAQSPFSKSSGYVGGKQFFGGGCKDRGKWIPGLFMLKDVEIYHVKTT